MGAQKVVKLLGGVPQPIVASQPLEVVLASLVNRIVIQDPTPPMIPKFELFPVNCPIRGEDVFGPSYA